MSRRRRIDAFVLVGLCLLLGAGASVAAAVGDTERIADYWASATVVEGEAQVVEVIDYDFGVNSRRGILRDADDLEPQADVAVSSPTAPDQFTATAIPGGTQLRIGDPDVTITGRHRYTIEYPLSTLVQGDTVSWNAIGTAWDVGTSDFELHLLVDRELTGIECSKGQRGAIGGCTAEQVEAGHLVVDGGSLDSGEGVTITATMVGAAITPAAVSVPEGPAEDPGTGWLVPGLVGAAAAAVAALALERPIRRRGEEQVWVGGGADVAFGPGPTVAPEVRTVDHGELEDMATTEFAPPRDISATIGGIIHDEAVRTDHKMAWLVEAGIRDEIELDGEDDDLVMRRGEAVPPPSVSNILATMFDERSTIPLGEFDEDFASGWKELDGQLTEWRQSSDLWDPRGRSTQRRWRLWAVLALLFGLAGLGIGAVVANRFGSGGLVLVVIGGLLAGGAVAVFVRSHELLVRTPRGSGLWVQIESFRRFIADSEARHAKMAAEMGVLREYTAWAVSLGELDHWTDTVQAAGLERDNPALHRDLAIIAATPALRSAVSSTSTAPSSSGSGGSFGGSVGGGGGGGGGGSW